jgi:hypothetical protein
MVETWGPDFYKKCFFSGGSAGTVFAVGIALGKSPEYLNEIYVDVSERCVKYGAFYYGSLFMEEAIRKIVEDPYSYKLLEGRCSFGTTAFFCKHRWHISWSDNEDLIDCAKASAHIPLYCQKNYGVKNTIVVDGAYGFAGKDLPHGDETLYVGIDPHAEISRSFTNKQMLQPSVGKDYEEMVQSGYDAFMAWSGQMNKKVGHRLPNTQALYFLWILKVVEMISDVFIWLFEFVVTVFKSFFANRILCK